MRERRSEVVLVTLHCRKMIQRSFEDHVKSIYSNQSVPHGVDEYSSKSYIHGTFSFPHVHIPMIHAAMIHE
jgi:DNA polymerase sigma